MARTKQQARLGLPRVDPICQGIKKCGDRCTNRKKYGDFCGVHAQKEECPICYETKCCEKLKCGHGICGGCSSQWFATKTTCPMCREVVKRATNWWTGNAQRYNPESQRVALQEELDELSAIAQAYLAVRMEINPDDTAARRRLEAITPRNLVSYFDLVE